LCNYILSKHNHNQIIKKDLATFAQTKKFMSRQVQTNLSEAGRVRWSIGDDNLDNISSSFRAKGCSKVSYQLQIESTFSDRGA